MKVTFQLEGAKELEANLSALGRRVQQRVVRKAVRAAQKPLLTAARSRARSLGSGVDREGIDMSALLARHIVIAAPKRQSPGTYSLHVQMRKGVKEFVGEGKRSGRQTYIPSAIEYGHMTGETYVPPLPFLRPAADTTTNERVRVLTDELRKGLL